MVYRLCQVAREGTSNRVNGVVSSETISYRLYAIRTVLVPNHWGARSGLMGGSARVLRTVSIA
jgi:hypothetical protein